MGDAVGIAEDFHLFMKAGEADCTFRFGKWTSNEYHPCDADEDEENKEN
jgi:hypothetical protein